MACGCGRKKTARTSAEIAAENEQAARTEQAQDIRERITAGAPPQQ